MAKKKEEVQQKMWALVHVFQGVEPMEVISAYNDYDEAIAARDELRMCIMNSVCGHPSDYYVREIPGSLKVKENFGVKYMVRISGATVKAKKKGKKGKKKITQKIFAGIGIRENDAYQDKVDKLATTLESLSADDYEIEAYAYDPVPCVTEEDLTRIEFNDVRKSYALFRIVIKGDEHRSANEVIAEFFKRIGM